MEERYEAPEVISFSDLDFEPATIDGECVSLFACDLRTFYVT